MVLWTTPKSYPPSRYPVQSVPTPSVRVSPAPERAGVPRILHPSKPPCGGHLRPGGHNRCFDSIDSPDPRSARTSVGPSLRPGLLVDVPVPSRITRHTTLDRTLSPDRTTPDRSTFSDVQWSHLPRSASSRHPLIMSVSSRLRLWGRPSHEPHTTSSFGSSRPHLPRTPYS